MNVFKLVVAPLTTLNTLPVGTWPLIVQAKVNGNPCVVAPVALRFIEPGIATTPPVAAGVCEAHVGATFLTTVQDLVAVLVPFEIDATSVLFPEFNCDESTFWKLAPEPSAEPFNDQETAQAASDGTTPKEVEVVSTDETLTLEVEGEPEVIEQLLWTFTVHEQTAES